MEKEYKDDGIYYKEEFLKTKKKLIKIYKNLLELEVISDTSLKMVKKKIDKPSYKVLKKMKEKALKKTNVLSKTTAIEIANLNIDLIEQISEKQEAILNKIDTSNYNGEIHQLNKTINELRWKLEDAEERAKYWEDEADSLSRQINGDD